MNFRREQEVCQETTEGSSCEVTGVTLGESGGSKKGERKDAVGEVNATEGLTD